MQAWCDVDTDTGGFLLIGVKDTPETWAIPSNSSFVHPQGPAKWSSEFGDKNVLDFRVQISASKNFHDTRAHWQVTCSLLFFAATLIVVVVQLLN